MREVNQSMWVRIHACKFINDPAYQGSVSSLLAHQEVMRDVSQRARLMEGEPYHLECGRDWSGFIKSVPDRYDHTLGESNLLIYRLVQITEKQIEAYEGILKAFPERNMKQVINSLCNLERFELLPGIRCDNGIGEMTIDNDLDSILKDPPGDIYPLLNAEKVGAYIREKENGVSTSRGYCYRASDQWWGVYDGEQFPKQVGHHPSQLLLCLAPKGIEPKDLGAGAWLEIPYDGAPKLRVLENLGLESFKQCRIAKVYTAVPLFEQLAWRDYGIDRWNEFVRKLPSMIEKELLKYKVVAECERYSGLEQAVRLIDRLGEYASDSVQVTYTTYGRECLEQIGADLETRVSRRFNFEGYEKELYAQTRKKPAAYGAVLKESGLEEVQAQDHSMMTQGIGQRR